MIFRPVSKYSLVNAKVRARLSTLLDPERISLLLVGLELTPRGHPVKTHEAGDTHDPSCHRAN